MGKTIIQPIGPLYGEPINGTVYGRPNGSVYVPDNNTITLSFSVDPPYVRTISAATWAVCNASRQFKEFMAAAQAQDNQSYIMFELASDDQFDTVVATATFTAGEFNVIGRNLTTVGEQTLVDEGTYYGRAVLMSSTNVPVAVSETAEITGVNPA